MIDLDKLPPQALDIEEIVLGSMMLDKFCLITGTSTLNPDTFYKSEHSIVYKSIQDLQERGAEVDLVTVVEQLQKNGVLKKAGGPGFVSALTNRVASTANFQEHCLIIKEREMARMQIAVAQNMIRMAYDPKQDVFKISEYMADKVHDIQNIGQIKSEQTNEDLAKQLVEQIERAGNMDGITGVPTGYKEQDKLFGGWQAPDLVIMAARPGMGKTAKILCDAFNQAVFYEKTVMIFSLEMSALQLFKRLASLATELDGDKFRRGNMSDADWAQFHANIGQIITDKIIIIDNCQNVQEVKNRIKRERMERQVDIAYIDYLQLMEGQGNNREQEISYISRSLKRLCLEINMPIIALSQLSRKVEERADKRPMLKDLRESGAIEQDADIVCFLYRPQYYDPDDEPGLAYLLVAKHRNGALMDIQLRFNHDRAQFLNVESQWGNF
jgi:replicative DNA helicase